MLITKIVFGIATRLYLTVVRITQIVGIFRGLCVEVYDVLLCLDSFAALCNSL